MKTNRRNFLQLALGGLAACLMPRTPETSKPPLRKIPLPALEEASKDTILMLPEDWPDSYLWVSTESVYDASKGFATGHITYKHCTRIE